MQSVTRPPQPKRFAAFRALIWCAVAACSLPLESVFAQASGAVQRHDRVLVRFKPLTQEAVRSQARASAGTEREIAFTLVPDLERLYLRPGRSVSEALALLRRHPQVQYAEPDLALRTSNAPNDPSYGNLWNMTRIQAPGAWSLFSGDQDFSVAILDTGIDRTHPDLQGNMWQNPRETLNGLDDDRNGYVDDLHGWDFAYNDSNPSDLNGHGTHVAGIIGARGNNGIGLSGIKWRARLVPLKILDDQGTGYTSSAIQALQYAAGSGIRVSNNSWSSSGYSQSLYDAIDAMKKSDHLFVASAGNGGTDGVGDNNDVTPIYPASFNLDNLISVAAITSSDARSGFSNFGKTSVDIAAPGSSILSTSPGGRYTLQSGTSVAVPHVAGAAALISGFRPGWTYLQVRSAILSSARAVGALSGTSVSGGVLNLAGAAAFVPDVSSYAVQAMSAPAAGHQVRLTWGDGSANESGFRIEVSRNGLPFAPLATVGPGMTAYTASGLAAATTYVFRVRAFNAAGDSDPSNDVMVRVPGDGEAPQTPAFAASAARGVANLSWRNTVGETGFQIGRANYNTARNTCDSMGGIRTVSADVTRATDAVSAGGTFCYAIRAYNGAAYSAWSSALVLTIPR